MPGKGGKTTPFSRVCPAISSGSRSRGALIFLGSLFLHARHGYRPGSMPKKGAGTFGRRSADRNRKRGARSPGSQPAAAVSTPLADAASSTPSSLAQQDAASAVAAPVRATAAAAAVLRSVHKHCASRQALFIVSRTFRDPSSPLLLPLLAVRDESSFDDDNVSIASDCAAVVAPPTSVLKAQTRFQF